jgi:hypothetical protein
MRGRFRSAGADEAEMTAGVRRIAVAHVLSPIDAIGRTLTKEV